MNHCLFIESDGQLLTFFNKLFPLLMSHFDESIPNVIILLNISASINPTTNPTTIILFFYYFDMIVFKSNAVNMKPFFTMVTHDHEHLSIIVFPTNTVFINN